MIINPIAYNFGLSECNRVKKYRSYFQGQRANKITYSAFSQKLLIFRSEFVMFHRKVKLNEKVILFPGLRSRSQPGGKDCAFLIDS